MDNRRRRIRKRRTRIRIRRRKGETSYSQRFPGGNQVDGLPPERHASDKTAFSRGQRLLIFLTFENEHTILKDSEFDVAFRLEN